MRPKFSPLFAVIAVLLTMVTATAGLTFAQDDVAPNQIDMPGVYSTTIGQAVTVPIPLPEGESIYNVDILAAPEHGALTITSEAYFVYTPDADFSGIDSFTYQIIGLTPATINLLVETDSDKKSEDDVIIAQSDSERVHQPPIIITPEPNLDTVVVQNLPLQQLASVNVPAPVADSAPDDLCTPEELANPLAYLSGYLDESSGFTIGYVTNTSNCDFGIGIASYYKFDENISNQHLFNAATGTAVARSTTPISVLAPTCARQLDLFYGHVINDLSVERYNERLLQAVHLGGTNYCSPTVVSGEPAVAIQYGPDQEIIRGESASLSLTVTNTGGVSLINMRTIAPNTDICSREPFDLDPGESVTFTCTSTPITTTSSLLAVVSGLADTAEFSSVEARVTTLITVVEPVAAMTVAYGPDQTINAGDTAALTLTVTNTGNIRLINLRSAAPETDFCSQEPFDLNPGESRTVNCTSIAFDATITATVSGLVDDGGFSGIEVADNATITVNTP